MPSALPSETFKAELVRLTGRMALTLNADAQSGGGWRRRSTLVPNRVKLLSAESGAARTQRFA